MPDPQPYGRGQITQLPSGASPRDMANYDFRIIRALLPFHQCHVYLSANSGAIPSGNSTWTDLAWDTEQEDTANLFNIGSTPYYVVVPEDWVYAIDAQMCWDSSTPGNMVGQRGMRVITNTGVVLMESTEGVNATQVRTVQARSCRARLAAGTQLKLQLNQNCGAGLAILGGGANVYLSRMIVSQF